MIETLLNKLPVGEGMKVFIGVSAICGVSLAMTLSRSGTGYDTMAEKREDKRKKQEAAERKAAADRIAAADATK
eukprot:CAMPEP_0181208682 /NCGR_PEP_ID=MMETSP1096-20121128/22252_1 /TAXON_ID=156174 ORGANISM="Chrysochromulina ericina, Strain CCMP281" /NCGR_SAMPLE_ID=MMETSP1096 /ASSEMBLY_ACC=CAM_ASM_000453 /LENGTH=73 /DNA_ID=CAMNT_0023299771 /DNA_START=39 /DNA_END=263 /DNA_ORIENTATION=-